MFTVFSAPRPRRSATTLRVEMLEDRAVPTVSSLRISEVLLNVPGTDTGFEYVEIRGTPNFTIPNDVYFVTLEGDNGSGGAGVSDNVLSLGGLQIGSNGYLLLLQNGNPWSAVAKAGTTTASATGSNWNNATLGWSGSDFENGTNSFLLIQAATAPTLATDYDTNNDGVLDNGGQNWTVLDSVGKFDGDTSDIAYGLVNFRDGSSGGSSATGSIVNVTFGEVEYLARIGISTGFTSTDWLAANTDNGSGPTSPTTLTIESNRVSASGFDNAPFNHLGGVNFLVIGDFVWEDTNLNGVQDSGEPGHNNVTVELRLASDDSLVATTTTDSDGFYAFLLDDFSTSTYGVDFVIFVTLPSGYGFTTQNQGTSTLDSDVDPLTGRVTVANVLITTHDPSIDAGIGLLNLDPVNSVPVAQVTAEDSPLRFSTGDGNLISISDPDAGSALVQISLTATNGTITLASGSGVSVTSGAEGSSTVTFQGTLTQLNAALDGLIFTPDLNYNGPASLQIDSDDLGNFGTGGARTDSDTVSITITPVNDAPVGTVSPTSGTTTAGDAFSLANFLTGVGPGGGSDEAGQNVTISVTSDQPSFFTTAPTISGGTLSFTTDPSVSGTVIITVTIMDDGGVTNGGVDTTTRTFTLTVLPQSFVPPVVDNRDRFAVGSGAGPTAQLRGLDGSTLNSVTPFGPGPTSGIRVVSADVTGDGVLDLIAAAGPGLRPSVVLYDGSTGAEIVRFDAFEAKFTGGVYVAAGDFDKDGFADIVVTPDQGGGPVVGVYRGNLLANGSVSQMVRFLGIDDAGFRGGARPAVGDVNGDGVPEIIISAGFLGGPRIQIWNGLDIAAGVKPTVAMANFFAFENTLRNGAFVAVGDIDGDGATELIFGGGPGGAPRVRVVDAAQLLKFGNSITSLDDLLIGQEASFFAGPQSDRGGVRVAALDETGDGQRDIVTSTPSSPNVLVYNFDTFDGTNPTDSFAPLGDVLGGVFVG